MTLRERNAPCVPLLLRRCRGRRRARRTIQQRVEHQLVGAVRLVAVLGTETDQHDLAGTVLHRHCRSLLCDHLLTKQPAALQEVPLGVGGQDLDILAAIR